MAKNFNVGDKVRYSMEYLIKSGQVGTKIEKARGVVLEKVKIANDWRMVLVQWDMLSFGHTVKTHEHVDTLIKTEVPVKR